MKDKDLQKLAELAAALNDDQRDTLRRLMHAASADDFDPESIPKEIADALPPMTPAECKAYATLLESLTGSDGEDGEDADEKRTDGSDWTPQGNAPQSSEDRATDAFRERQLNAWRPDEPDNESKPGDEHCNDEYRRRLRAEGDPGWF